ncbi:MAG: carbamoyltransferase family protein, partial [Flavisolibacter sp.]
MKILGISAYYHDAAAAIVSDNSIMAAVQEERFTRIKHDANFPSMSVSYCLKHSGLRLNDLDAIIFYDKPFLKFERLIETYHNNAPTGFKSFVKAMPVWLKEKIFVRKILSEELLKIDPQFKAANAKILFSEHHLSHAASAFYSSGFENASILTIDGVGEWATASISAGTDNEIKILKELHFPDSVGLLYSAFTYFLGFKVNSGEYKMMGLAPYGNHTSVQTKHFISLIKDQLVTIYENGSIRLNRKYFNYEVGLKMIHPLLWQNMFGVSPRDQSDPIEQSHCNLALAIQTVTEQIIELMAKHTKALTGLQNLCLAGGVALNSVANGKLGRTRIFKKIFIQPAAGDAGGALGAALAANHIYFKQERIILDEKKDAMQNALLGPEYSHLDILQTIRRFNAPYKRYDIGELNKSLALYLKEGMVVGWFQGRMEFGPRALGSRSILA